MYCCGLHLMSVHQTVRSIEPYCPCIRYHSSWTKRFKIGRYGSEKNDSPRFDYSGKREVD